MSWSEATPAPTMAGTPSYLAPVRRAEPNANAPVVEQPVNLSTAIYLGVFSRARNQTIDIGSYHCPVTLATKVAISAGMDFARGR
jgi:hypothetical protein